MSKKIKSVCVIVIALLLATSLIIIVLVDLNNKNFNLNDATGNPQAYKPFTGDGYYHPTKNLDKIAQEKTKELGTKKQQLIRQAQINLLAIEKIINQPGIQNFFQSYGSNLIIENVNYRGKITCHVTIYFSKESKQCEVVETDLNNMDNVKKIARLDLIEFETRLRYEIENANF